MSEKHSYFTLFGKSPLTQLFVSLLLILLSGLVLLTVSILAWTLIFDGSSALLSISSADFSENEIPFLRYLLISQHISLFIIPGIILIALLNPDNKLRIGDFNFPRIRDVVLVIGLAFCIFPITSFTGEFNSGMHLPDWLSGVEEWMIGEEGKADSLIDLLIASDRFWIMILNLLTIAVIPAIGEELIFRGVFQKIGYKLFKSGNLAIWVTAFFFSAIHLQFFGFLPRFILGLVFGYLFLWSGTLWLPVIAHFVNNAVPVIGAYIQGWDKFNTVPDIGLWEMLPGLPVPVIISLLILLYFRNKFKKIGGFKIYDEDDNR